MDNFFPIFLLLPVFLFLIVYFGWGKREGGGGEMAKSKKWERRPVFLLCVRLFWLCVQNASPTEAARARKYIYIYGYTTYTYLYGGGHYKYRSVIFAV
jgi:hypothetical protein